MDQFESIAPSKVATVAARIRDLVHTGVLRDGDVLPSTRSLAADLGVARGTVVAAYEQLDGEGYIRTRQGAAARVAISIDRPSEPSNATSQSTAPSPSSAPDGIPARTLVDLRPGIPSVRAIPVRDWRAAWRAGAALPLENVLSDPMGSAALRTQIAAQLGIARGFFPDPDRVVVTAGTSEGLSVLAEALGASAGRRARIIVEDPGYRSGRRAMELAGALLTGVPVGEAGLDLDVLEAVRRRDGVPDAVIVTPTHQYPLGSVMPVAQRQRLIAWAAEHGTVVVEDDYDSEFRHRGEPVPALAALDADGVVLHMGGFSKTLDPRVRCAYTVLPTKLLPGMPGSAGHRSARRAADAIRASRTARGAVVSEVTQEAMATLLRTGAMRRHLGRVRRDYAHRRDLIARRVAATCVPGLEAHALSGGLHAVLTWPGPIRAEQARAAMAARGYAIEALARYSVDPSHAADGLVMGYAAATVPQLDAAIDALEEILLGA